jgi:hypothetical protein
VAIRPVHERAHGGQHRALPRAWLPRDGPGALPGLDFGAYVQAARWGRRPRSLILTGIAHLETR